MANKKNPKNPVNQNTNTKNSSNSRPVNSYPGYSAPKKSMVIRVLILVVAALMFIGAIAIPFMASGSFKY